MLQVAIAEKIILKNDLDEKIVLLKEHVKGIKTRLGRLNKNYGSLSSTCSDKITTISSNKQA